MPGTWRPVSLECLQFLNRTSPGYLQVFHLALLTSIRTIGCVKSNRSQFLMQDCVGLPAVSADRQELAVQKIFINACGWISN